MYKYFVCVTGQNNNKFYEMTENGDGTWTARYGRVGGKGTTKVYPMSKWDAQIVSRERKGYVDHTHLMAKSAVDMVIKHSSKTIERIFKALYAAQATRLSANYQKVEGVTQVMIDEAQKVLDNLWQVNPNKVDQLNSQLLNLYRIIPRKMSKVQDELFANNPSNIELKEKLEAEQELLDSLTGQVANSDDNETDLLEAMGIEVYEPTADEVAFVKKQLGEISDKLVSVVGIRSPQQDPRFNEFVATSSNKTVKTYWHGSRNENWLSILKTGLILRPTNVKITGKMFGYGIYFAPKAKKSLGYTSLDGSYWAGGNQATGYMTLYDVHVGKSYVTDHQEDWMRSATESTLKQKGDYDSVHAKAGRSLYNDEVIVYNERQIRPRYLVELKK